MSQTLSITNVKIILPDKIISPGTVVIKGRKIIAIGKGCSVPRGAVKINARGNFVAPGFIDLHIHGDVEKISHGQVKGGTIGFLVTLHPEAPQALLKNIAQVLAKREKVYGAKVLGLGLEGPFLNRQFCGALAKKFLRKVNIGETQRIIRQAHGTLKMMVLAPELKDAPKLIRHLRRHKIIASLGHSAATYGEAKRGIKAGITYCTHTFNRMRAFDHHSPGALGAVLTDECVCCEVIAEENHVHPAALKILLACKGLDKIVLVTDSTQALESLPKRRFGNIFKLNNGTLCGTALTLNQALRNTVNFLGLSISEAVKLVTLNPARVLRIEKRKGSLAVGKDADLVIFDKDFNIKLTMVEGRIVYKTSALRNCSHRIISQYKGTVPN